MTKELKFQEKHYCHAMVMVASRTYRSAQCVWLSYKKMVKPKIIIQKLRF